MSFRRALQCNVSVTVVVLALAICALWVAGSTESGWRAGGEQHHVVRLGVLSWIELSFDRAAEGLSWSFSWRVQTVRLLITLAVSVPLVLYGHRSMQRCRELDGAG